MKDKTQKEMHIQAIGSVQRNGSTVWLEVWPEFRPALRELDQFSHVMVFWWADRYNDVDIQEKLLTRPPYAEDHLTGIFATRSPIRPNPITMTTCKIKGVDEAQGRVEVENLDAFAGTALLDLKAYFPICDRVREATIPPWLNGWPEWMPEEGIGLGEWEQE